MYRQSTVFQPLIGGSHCSNLLVSEPVFSSWLQSLRFISYRQRNQRIISASGTKKAFPASEERRNQSGRFQSNQKRNSTTWKVGFSTKLHAVSAKTPSTYVDKYTYLLPQVRVLPVFASCLIWAKNLLGLMIWLKKIVLSLRCVFGYSLVTYWFPLHILSEGISRVLWLLAPQHTKQALKRGGNTNYLDKRSDYKLHVLDCSD